MKNKKIISATVIALLAPTLLNCQVALAEATNSQEEATTPEVTTSSETEEATASMNEEAVAPKVPENQETTESSALTSPSETQESETATSDSATTPQASEVGKDSIDTKDIGILDPEEGDVVINAFPIQSVIKGSPFNPMEGVTAYDNIARKDITNEVKTSFEYYQTLTDEPTVVNSVDTNVEGFYFITYTVTTENGTATIYRLIVIEATNVGMYSIEIADFTLTKNGDLGAAINNKVVVRDAYGKVIPNDDINITLGGKTSTSEVGINSVVIGVLSTHGTITNKTVKVTIVDPIKINAADKEIFVGDTFDVDSYATATGLDNDGNTIDLPVNAVSNNVDITTPGTYTVVYGATDSFGNTDTKEVKITVSEKPEIKASITVENKVMYVGDKLTEEMILNWATFENIEGYKYGYEILGSSSIKVSKPGNTLVEPGTHEIKYYATKGKDDHQEKVIILTILASRANEGSGNESDASAAETIAPVENNNNTKKEPVKEIKKKTEKQLPETGTQESSMMMTSIGLTLIASVYFMKKRKESEFDLY